MNDLAHVPADAGEWKPVEFTGRWTEFLPIALTNLLLTIVTLGIYRFWAAARERRYLWSRTHFIDDSFEWTGTGWEMFRGFLLVMLVLIPLLIGLNFGLQALVLRGEIVAAIVLGAVLYVGLFFLFNVARFRAIRYRLSRSYWHGIRGGSDDAGWSYGWAGVWKMVAAFLSLGLLTPWAMTSLWNDRMNKMSYGPYPFEASATSSGLLKRWLLLYAGLVAAIVAIGVLGARAGMRVQPGREQEALAQMAGAIGVVMIIFYIAVPILLLAYYAAFYRKVAASTALGPLRFGFTARTKDWLFLFLGSIGLVIITLGVALLFLRYRNWKFVVTHLEAQGEVDFEALAQSTTRAPGEAEGMADMFDIGAI